MTGSSHLATTVVCQVPDDAEPLYLPSDEHMSSALTTNAAPEWAQGAVGRIQHQNPATVASYSSVGVGVVGSRQRSAKWTDDRSEGPGGEADVEDVVEVGEIVACRFAVCKTQLVANFRAWACSERHLVSSKKRAQVRTPTVHCPVRRPIFAGSPCYCCSRILLQRQETLAWPVAHSPDFSSNSRTFS